MKFSPYVLDTSNNKVSVTIRPITHEDEALTEQDPRWQTSWLNSELKSPEHENFAACIEDEVIALASYEVWEDSLVVHIAYMESSPNSNPTIVGQNKKYTGIGRMLVGFGIKLSVDMGFGGVVVLEAKTSELEKHYVEDFKAVRLPRTLSAAPRFIIADEAAQLIFSSYLAK
ncbi:MAG: hypothetical protein LUG57_02320 [Oscillospiraceae bacterium]|nr:hypothetical protein [Oscillospiraceae bacterium]